MPEFPPSLIILFQKAIVERFYLSPKLSDALFLMILLKWGWVGGGMQ